MISFRASIALAAALGMAACQSPSPPASPPVAGDPAPPAPIVKVRPDIITPPADSEQSKPSVRLAARNPLLEDWKQRAAERIHEANRKELFEGRPEHLLRAVVVVEATVDRLGKVTTSKIMRSPGIASLNNSALRSLQTASPLPSPPPSLVTRGALVYQETWLFQKDGRFQLRSLALPQE